MSKQHIQLPNKMGIDGLKPKDQLVYVGIRAHMNNNTMEAFPSLDTISKEIKASIPTIRSSIERLKEKEYISVRKEGRKNVYIFNKLVHFEPFSKDFLENDKISLEAKAFITASQQYMFKDIEGLGKISMSNRDLAKQINMPESTVRKCNNELVRKNYLTIIKNESKDIETGCKTDTKIFNLNELGQAIIWTLSNHEDRITQNSEDISELKDMLSKQQKMINALLKERQIEPAEYKL